ncbi:hypothetical protein MUK42_35840 [Musa troglodytarum]|uniref:Uncharacterized protein n=1 Tax=Musa troglodytarum TaxID=320322 RepID=A0A9E7JBD6_9LILI|nr:hypothetical protein MUK42_35840 [Musa troglodytarum]URD74820.1 hypothetical protein MUK42_35840 [Musa troglodytarum]URD74821.1 hypothetical protein MUK42_35840 [Musa troglodytarum]
MQAHTEPCLITGNRERERERSKPGLLSPCGCRWTNEDGDAGICSHSPSTTANKSRGLWGHWPRREFPPVRPSCGAAHTGETRVASEHENYATLSLLSHKLFCFVKQKENLLVQPIRAENVLVDVRSRSSVRSTWEDESFVSLEGRRKEDYRENFVLITPRRGP